MKQNEINMCIHLRVFYQPQLRWLRYIITRTWASSPQPTKNSTLANWDDPIMGEFPTLVLDPSLKEMLFISGTSWYVIFPILSLAWPQPNTVYQPKELIKVKFLNAHAAPKLLQNDSPHLGWLEYQTPTAVRAHHLRIRARKTSRLDSYQLHGHVGVSSSGPFVHCHQHKLLGTRHLNHGNLREQPNAIPAPQETRPPQ